MRDRNSERILQSTCAGNNLGCNKHGLKNIGLLLTKDDGDILNFLFQTNSQYFSALVILDGSESIAQLEIFSLLVNQLITTTNQALKS